MLAALNRELINVGANVKTGQSDNLWWCRATVAGTVSDCTVSVTAEPLSSTLVLITCRASTTIGRAVMRGIEGAENDPCSHANALLLLDLIYALELTAGELSLRINPAILEFHWTFPIRDAIPTTIARFALRSLAMVDRASEPLRSVLLGSQEPGEAFDQMLEQGMNPNY